MPGRRPLLIAMLAAAIGAILDREATAADRVRVLASFSILADLVREVGGDRVQVTALVGPDQDMHAFEPRPSDLRALRACDVLVTNGLGLEGWVTRLSEAAGFKGISVEASRGIDPLFRAGSGAPDPHAWQDVANVKRYVARIRDGLVQADPHGADVYERQTVRYVARLDALDAEVRSLLAPIPRARRRVVTNHDAFGYYARAYDVEMLAPLGSWSGSEPTARDLASLTAQIRDQGITALFLENITPGAALRTLARETGVRIGGKLYSDALSPAGGPAATYVDMMMFNTTAIAAALR